MKTAREKYWDTCADITDRFEKVTARRFEELKSWRKRQNLINGRKAAIRYYDIERYRATWRKACQTLG